MNYTNPTSAV